MLLRHPAVGLYKRLGLKLLNYTILDINKFIMFDYCSYMFNLGYNLRIVSCGVVCVLLHVECVNLLKQSRVLSLLCFSLYLSLVKYFTEYFVKDKNYYIL